MTPDHPDTAAGLRLVRPGACPSTRRAVLRRLGPGLVAAWLAGSLPGPVRADPGESSLFPAPSGKPRATLLLHSSTDTVLFAPLIRDFQQRVPDVAVRYHELTTRALHDAALQRAGRTGPPGSPTLPADPRADALSRRLAEEQPDLLLSSSMDLQTQLVNDGLALPHPSAETAAVPAWARWRNELFGFSREPAVIVYHRGRLPARRVPHTRRELIALLQAPDAPLKGRVGAYDVPNSGVGYVIATQNARLDSASGTLLAALGANQVQLAQESSVLLDRLARGELTLAVDMLGSYAQARIDAGAPLGIVMPQDYTLLLSRTVLIPRTAPQPALARDFLDHLLSRRGQQVLVDASRMLPIRTDLDRPAQAGAAASALATIPPLRPIPLGPGLLVYLDSLKRQQFLLHWQQAMQPPGP